MRHSVDDASADASDTETLVGSGDGGSSRELTQEDGSTDNEGVGDGHEEVAADGAGSKADEDKDRVVEDGTNDGRSGIDGEDNSTASSVQEEVLVYLGDYLGDDVDSEDDNNSSVA